MIMKSSAILSSILLLLVLTTTITAQLTTLSGYGANPSNLKMFMYKPSSLKNGTCGIVLAVHYCTGSASAVSGGYGLNPLADQYNLVVIYPESTNSDKCFDVASVASLKHDGGSDSLGMVNAVKYVQTQYKCDPSRTISVGQSSGAMTTQLLMGAYPDVFAGGGECSGVPYGCFATTDGSRWNNACSGGTLTKTGAQWGDLVRKAYPGYTGVRPRLQLWHGTADTTLNYNNFKESIKQWTNVFNLSETPAHTLTNTPLSGYTRTRYGCQGDASKDDHCMLEAYSGQGVGHSATWQPKLILKFTGLDGSFTNPVPGSNPTVVVNGCATTNGGCDTSANGGICTVSGTGVTCSCSPGYTLGTDKKTCSKVTVGNACATSNGGCDAAHGTCAITGTTVTCSCATGYDLGVDKKTCTAAPVADPCMASFGGCDEANGECDSVAGKVTCSCKEPFTLAADKKKCIGGDKCSGNPCGTYGSCTLVGTTDFKCTCIPNYSGKLCDLFTDPNSGGNACLTNNGGSMLRMPNVHSPQPKQ